MLEDFCLYDIKKLIHKKIRIFGFMSMSYVKLMNGERFLFSLEWIILMFLRYVMMEYIWFLETRREPNAEYNIG